MSENGKITIDETRAALLNGYTRRTKLVTVAGGVSLLIQEPTVAQRGRILKHGGMSTSQTEASDFTGMQVAAVIECVLDPATQKKIFSYTDEATLTALPTNIWFDEVAKECMDMMSGDPEAGKPLSETQEELISSSSPPNSEEQSQN